MTKDRKTKDIFFGIVAIATLIVAIIGATLAYFSITTMSNEGAIHAHSAQVTIEYKDGNQVTAQADKLIPASLEVVQKVYQHRFHGEDADATKDPNKNICVDANSQQVCSVYRFSVHSDSKREIIATINSEFNAFTYLAYGVADAETGEWIALTDATGDEAVYSRDLDRCISADDAPDPTVPEDDSCWYYDSEQGGIKRYLTEADGKAIGSYSLFGTTSSGAFKAMTIPKDTTREFDVILFIRNRTDVNQNVDQGKDYSGTLKIEVAVDEENGGISGEYDESWFE